MPYDFVPIIPFLHYSILPAVIWIQTKPLWDEIETRSFWAGILYLAIEHSLSLRLTFQPNTAIYLGTKIEQAI